MTMVPDCLMELNQIGAYGIGVNLMNQHGGTGLHCLAGGGGLGGVHHQAKACFASLSGRRQQHGLGVRAQGVGHRDVPDLDRLRSTRLVGRTAASTVASSFMKAKAPRMSGATWMVDSSGPVATIRGASLASLLFFARSSVQGKPPTSNTLVTPLHR